jgi:uncharacterized OB-fold protein
MMDRQTPPPSPRINALNRPFWEGCRAGELRLQRCMDPACGRAIHYPRVCCPHCQSDQLSWISASGLGRVISHTTVRRTHHDGFNPLAPYVFAAIELVEGPLLYARLVGVGLDERLIGRQVRVRFDPGPQDPPVAVFEVLPH